MIEVVNVNKTFGEKHVLKDINATFDEGKVNMIIGRSGSGKTVLLKNIVGLVTPETGEIYFNGREFVNVDEKAKREIRKESFALSAIKSSAIKQYAAPPSLPSPGRLMPARAMLVSVTI